MKDYNFTEFQEIREKEKLVLADFYASWCGPCKMLAPIIEELYYAYENRVKIVKVNVDNERKLAEMYRVSSIPTIILFKNGSPVEYIVGYKAKDAFVKMINKHLE